MTSGRLSTCRFAFALALALALARAIALRWLGILDVLVVVNSRCVEAAQVLARCRSVRLVVVIVVSLTQVNVCLSGGVSLSQHND